MTRILATSLAVSVMANFGWGAETDLDKLVGRQVDIAPSAYQYRADRIAEDNPPESWLALMRYANLPLNQPLDLNAPAIKQVLCGLLWEEIRPVQSAHPLHGKQTRCQATGRRSEPCRRQADGGRREYNPKDRILKS